MTRTALAAPVSPADIAQIGCCAGEDAVEGSPLELEIRPRTGGGDRVRNGAVMSKPLDSDVRSRSLAPCPKDRYRGRTWALALFSPNAPAHLRRTAVFEHVADIMVNSFYDPDLDQGCALEELISFHGGLGGPQTRPFVLYPVDLPVPEGPIVGAAGVHGLLTGWRSLLQDESRPDAVAVATGGGPERTPAGPQRGLL